LFERQDTGLGGTGWGKWKRKRAEKRRKNGIKDRKGNRKRKTAVKAEEKTKERMK
jgi:hypothetical protein